MISKTVRLLAAATLFTLAAGPVEAADRGLLYLPRDQAAERVAQLSPGSGIVPGYRHQRLVQPYRPGQVIFEGNVPTGIVARDGSVRPLGAFAESRRFYRQRKPAPVVVQVAPPRHAVLGVQTRAVHQATASTLDPIYLPQVVDYDSAYAVGTIVIDTRQKFLYRVEGHGKARRYGVGVGKEGFGWTGTHAITRKAEWPGWTPPAEMIARERAKGRMLPAHMPGGPENPLGARALYLGSTLYRIHGTNQPWTIGQEVSSGCIRMRNEDVVDLYGRTGVGVRVIVL